MGKVKQEIHHPDWITWPCFNELSPTQFFPSLSSFLLESNSIALVSILFYSANDDGMPTMYRSLC